MANEPVASLARRGWLYGPEFAHHWERRPLYSLARWVNGIAFRDVHFSPTGKPVIKIGEIKGGITDQTGYTEQVFDDSVHVLPGDLLFAWSGQPETSIDVSWWRGPNGWLNQHIFRVTPSPDVDRTFFYYLLRYLRPNFIGIARNKQTTGLGHVTRRDLENIEAAFPSMPEQRAIAQTLGTLDDRIELNRHIGEEAESVARALFKAWFIDFDPVLCKSEGRDAGLPRHLADLFPDSLEASELGPIPAGWRAVPLPEVIEVNPARSLSKGALAPYLDMANMPTRGHSPTTVIDRPFGSGMRFRNGDTLVARITPCLENGKTAFVDFLEDGQIGWGSTEYIVLRPKPPTPVEFAYCLARDEGFREFAIQSMTGSSGRQRVPVDALVHFLVPAPPAAISDAFAGLVRPLIGRAAAAKKEADTLAAIRDELLPNLFSGEVRLPQAEQMVEAIQR